ncbi:hypothetical protein B0A48_01808 [Cryoendolithus antarcticus]|uniref:CAF1-domain-containing protein n=1 Tax=Cryoendolithus antarcticus TaxID=1507870 RepID=A0A1V8TQC0_9PEZI|nr:hypothetical protein B0A48_01808 [Cryoendolithus antarcticus]
MDVNKTSFYPLILDILADISESHFVAFDLELSGVPVKQTGTKRRAGRATLQERYVEVKEAAEKYTILQIGLTCVTEDAETGKYICKPYNFELTPLVDVPGLDLERDFSFSSSATDFLIRVGYDFSKPFSVGIPYMAPDEIRQARESHANRQDKSAIQDLQLKESDVESLALLQRVRSQINTWLADGSPEAESYITITPVATTSLGEDTPEMTRFARRLIHQVVRAEYPKLVTVSRRGGIQIVHFVQEREARILADRKAELKERIGRQKGFSWIVESLLGINISDFNLRLCATDKVTGEAVYADMDEYNAHFHRAEFKLRSRPRVMVGHNCFLDLVYIYRTFIGPLPDSVDEFSKLMHKHWPLIVDTKYMATHNCGDINPASSLGEIATQLEHSEIHIDELDPLHSKYQDVQVFHEAGFDSWLTAQIAIRLSMKLEREGAYVEDVDDEQGGVELGSHMRKPSIVSSAVATGQGLLSAAVKAFNLGSAGPATGPRDASNIKDAESPSTSNEMPQANKSYAQASIPIPQKTPTKPANASLSLSPQAEAFVPSSLGNNWIKGGDPAIGAVAEDDLFKIDPNKKAGYQPTKQEIRGIEGGMPRFTADFWRVYGNRLRVFGTEEGVCVLQGTE